MNERQPTVLSRLAFLDGIRALAASYVVIHHMYLEAYPGYPTNTGPWFLGWLLYGQYGVAVFIVVSGFSLALAPARHDFRLQGGFGHYIGRRAWRIIPPYWAALLASFLLMAFVVSRKIPNPVDLRGLGTHFLLVQDAIGGKTPNGALWSIAVEWQLYFLFPLLLLARRRLGAPATALVAFAGVALLKFAASEDAAVGKLLRLTPQFAALFVFGMVAAGATVARSSGRRIPWGWLGVALAGALAVWSLEVGTAVAIANFYWDDLVIGAATACALAAFVGVGARPVRRLLEHRSLVGLGRFSYSLYLVHAPLVILAWLFVVEPLHLSHNASFALMVVAVAPAIVAVAYGFFCLFERPFLERRSVAALVAMVAPWRRLPVDPPPEGVGEAVDPQLALETPPSEPLTLEVQDRPGDASVNPT